MKNLKYKILKLVKIKFPKTFLFANYNFTDHKIQMCIWCKTYDSMTFRRFIIFFLFKNSFQINKTNSRNLLAKKKKICNKKVQLLWRRAKVIDLFFLKQRNLLFRTCFFSLASWHKQEFYVFLCFRHWISVDRRKKIFEVNNKL